MERAELGQDLTLPNAIIDHLNPSAAAVRAALLDGLVLPEDLAAGVAKGIRTVRQWMAEGKVPVVYIGRTPYIPIAEARAALLKPSARNLPARKAGRPRKAV